MGQAETVAWSLGKPPSPAEGEFSIGQAPVAEWSVGAPAPAPTNVKPYHDPDPMDHPVSVGGEDWVTKGLSGPLTYLGQLLRGKGYVGSKEEAEDLKHGIHPGPLNLMHPSRGITSPLFDLGAATGVPRGIPSAITDTLSGFTSPQQLPLAFAPGSKVISGAFALATPSQVMQGYEKYKAAEKAGDKAGMQEAGTEIGINFILGAMASYHAGGVGEPLGKDIHLSNDEHAYLSGMIQQHLETSLENGDHAGIEEATHAMGSILPDTQRVLHQSVLEETIEADKKALAREGNPAEIDRITRHMNDFQEMLHEFTTKQAKADIPQREGEPVSRSTNSPSATSISLTEAPQLGEENLRPDSGAARREGSPGDSASNSPQQEGDRRQTTEGKLAQLSTLVPDFQKLIGGGEPSNVTGAQSTADKGESLEPPPVISQEIDRDLANGGITVVRGGQDIGLISRYLGSLTQAANRLGNPIFKMAADRIVDTSLAIARNTRDALVGFRKEVRGKLTPDEWDQVVDLLDDRTVGPHNLPPTTPSNIRQGYNYTRELLDRHRVEARDAKRLEMVAGGMSLAKAKSIVPDDWGIKEGYYVHAFPGSWTITELTGVDARGNDIYEPITTGWRATTLTEAQAKAREYLAANPQSNLKVALDNITLPGKAIADRNRLKALHEEITSASTFIHNGANPDGVMKDLRDASSRLNFGPRRPAPKTFGPTLERESNLPGWARDFDNFERYIQGMERYIQLAPARAEILKYRNGIAKGSNMPEVLKPGDFPKRYTGDFHNTLGRLDASIEALEGYPTGLDASIRQQLQKFGYDPNLVNRAYSTINSVEALLKLGFNPASAGLHLAQTIVATYPVLGEKWTAYGISKAYSSKYNTLVHDLAIEATTNLLDVDTYKAYRAGYGRSISESSSFAEGAKGFAGTAYHDLQATGLFMFSKGVETARRVAAIGAYEKGLSEGMSEKEARDYARDTLIRTQFLYNPVDTPLIMRAMPRPLTQFKNFTIKMMEFMLGLRGAEVPRFMLGLAGIGAAGIPLLNAISSIVKGIWGYDPENELKKAYPRASRGVLGGLGIDYTHNVGFSEWLGGHSYDPKNFVGPAGSDLAGVIKGIAGMVKGPSREGQQDADMAFRNISPEARRLWDEGKRMAGAPNLTDPRNDSTILKGLTPLERIELTAGLTPIKVAQERDIHEYIRNQVDQAKDKKGWFVDKLAQLALDLSNPSISESQRGDSQKQLIDISRMAQEYEVWSPHFAKDVVQRAKDMQMERLLRDVKKAPKGQRYGAYQEMERFNQENK